MSQLLQNGKFTVLNDEGKDVECELLFSFDNEENQRSYVVYTDNTVDEEGNTNVYASLLDSSDGSLHPIESEDEWKTIEDILSIIKDEVDTTLDISQWITDMAEKIKEAEDFDLRNCVSAVERKIFDVDNGDYVQELFGLLKAANDKSRYIVLFGDIGMRAYEKGLFELAELAFYEADAKNNLAYIIRRKEVKNPLKYTNKYVAELLQEGVHIKEPFSMINMSLLWAINIGTEENWKLADDIMSSIPKDRIMSALSWWMDVAKKGDIEGDLVHYWMLRHGKIDETSLGSKSELIEKISAKIPEIPEFMLN